MITERGPFLNSRPFEFIRAEERLNDLANFDSLTALPNRTLFDDRLAQAISQATWHKRSMAVLFLDLDRFKIINDTLGHAFGDLLLRPVAERLMQCIREGDTVARRGGRRICHHAG